MSIEEERKFQVDAAFTVPDLSAAGRVVTRPAVTLRATYYDTADRALTRAGVSLRRRKGDEPGKVWTVKLPSGKTGTRHEHHRPSAGGKVVPPDLVDLVTAFRRGAPLAPAVTVRTVRVTRLVSDAAGDVLAEVADDTVSVLESGKVVGQFREIEVERVTGTTADLDALSALLVAAGAVAGDFVPKHERAIGPVGPPDLTPPSPLRTKARAGEVVTEALRADIARIFRHDPFARARELMPNGDTPVHQMRVGTRRLRSDLQTFQALLDPAWTGPLRERLSRLADALGGARDAEVLRARLQVTAVADPLAPLDPAAVARIDAVLVARHEGALSLLDEALRAPEYVALLDDLVAAAAKPKLSALAAERAVDVLPAIVRKPWRRLVLGGGAAPGAGALTPDLPDDEWHEVRKRAKRARYAADAVAAVVGPDATALAKRIAKAQKVLGEHQDAAIAGDTWLEIAALEPSLGVTAGRLFERERAAVIRARTAFPAVWEAVEEENTTAWLK